MSRISFFYPPGRFDAPPPHLQSSVDGDIGICCTWNNYLLGTACSLMYSSMRGSRSAPEEPAGM
jgi:hypothetical protein